MKGKEEKIHEKLEEQTARSEKIDGKGEKQPGQSAKPCLRGAERSEEGAEDSENRAATQATEKCLGTIANELLAEASDATLGLSVREEQRNRVPEAGEEQSCAKQLERPARSEQSCAKKLEKLARSEQSCPRQLERGEQ